MENRGPSFPNENAGRLLCRLLHDNMKGFSLEHLSRENNYEELAYETVCSEVTLGDNLISRVIQNSGGTEGLHIRSNYSVERTKNL